MIRLMALLMFLLCSPTVFGFQQAPPEDSQDEEVKPVVETITVTAKQTPRKDEVSTDVRTYPANASAMNANDIAATPHRDAGEIIRALPGVDYVYYGQGGIPSGPSVRGYTDRNFGQDIAGSMDGIPLNLAGFVASHGALDLTPIFPDALERVELVRGPFDARYGDFHRGASLNFVTRDTVPGSSVGAVLGSFGSRSLRATFGNGDRGKTLSVYATVDAHSTDGYADNQSVEHVKGFAKLYMTSGEHDFSLMANVYTAEWDAPSYLDQRLLENGTIDDTDAVNPTDGGDLDATIAAFRYRHGASGSNPLTATIYTIGRDWRRWRHDSLISPTQTQVRQMDDRTTFGYRVEKQFSGALAGRPSLLLIGTTLQRDDVATQQDRTRDRAPIGAIDNIDEVLTHIGLYVQEQLVVNDWLKMTGGLRYSSVDYELDDKIRAKGTYVDSFSDGKIDPKVGVVLTPFAQTEIFAHYSTGMRSPTPRTEVRNSTSSIDAVKVADTENYEFGVAFRPTPRIELRADVWRSDNSNEIRGIPPGGVQFESLGRSRREGFDFDTTIAIGKGTLIFAGYSEVEARLLTPARPDAIYLPDIPAHVGQIGFLRTASMMRGNVKFGADIAFYGERDLNTTGTIDSDPYERITAHFIYKPDSGSLELWLKGFGYPGSRYGESAFLFGSSVGVRPNPRASVEAGVSFAFGR